MRKIIFRNNSCFNFLRQYSRIILGFLITFICFIIIAYQIDFQNLIKAISEFQPIYLVFGVGALVLSYCSRIARWTLTLKAGGASIGVRKCITPFLGSITMNNLLPLRTGDVLRAVIFPSAMGISKTVSTCSIVIERLLDLLTILFCLSLGFALTKQTIIPNWIFKTFVILLIVSGMALITLFLFSGKLAKYFRELANKRISSFDKFSQLLSILSNLLEGFMAMSRLSILTQLFGLSLLVWLCESGLFWFLLAGFHLQPTEASALIVMAIVTLSTLVPSSPGYIGPFHLAGFAVISMLGASKDTAASFALLSHLAIWVPTTLAGVIGIWLTPELFNSVMVRREIKIKNQKK